MNIVELSDEAKEALYDNLWDLYDSSEKEKDNE
jgi:hypothetical protein